MVDRVGFEPTKAEPADLQSAPFSHSGTCPQYVIIFNKKNMIILAKAMYFVNLFQVYSANGKIKKALHDAKPCFCSGDPSRIRTCDLLIRSQTLYPAELWSHVSGGPTWDRTKDQPVMSRWLYR